MEVGFVPYTPVSYRDLRTEGPNRLHGGGSGDERGEAAAHLRTLPEEGVTALKERLKEKLGTLPGLLGSRSPKAVKKFTEDFTPLLDKHRKMNNAYTDVGRGTAASRRETRESLIGDGDELIREIRGALKSVDKEIEKEERAKPGSLLSVRLNKLRAELIASEEKLCGAYEHWINSQKPTTRANPVVVITEPPPPFREVESSFSKTLWIGVGAAAFTSFVLLALALAAQQQPTEKKFYVQPMSYRPPMPPPPPPPPPMPSQVIVVMSPPKNNSTINGM